MSQRRNTRRDQSRGGMQHLWQWMSMSRKSDPGENLLLSLSFTSFMISRASVNTCELKETTMQFVRVTLCIWRIVIVAQWDL